MDVHDRPVLATGLQVVPSSVLGTEDDGIAVYQRDLAFAQGFVLPQRSSESSFEGVEYAMSDFPALPPAIQKAIGDNPYHYLVKLRSGEVYSFNGAEYDPLRPDWVTLHCGEWEQGGDTSLSSSHAMPIQVTGRGIDIRVSEIVAAIDCVS